MAVHFDQIVPWGRLYREYELMFALTPETFRDGILDCGGGPSSFTAESSAAGHRVVAVDPLYTFAGIDIRARFDATSGPMLAQVRATPGDWTWTFHRDPEDLLANRRLALERFLADYPRGRLERRYVVGELPSLAFPGNSFGLALCSHLLFLYSELLSGEFHIQSVRELCRVAGEVRIFPLLTLERKTSPHLPAVRAVMESDGWKTEIVWINYEFQRGGNRMLRIFR